MSGLEQNFGLLEYGFEVLIHTRQLPWSAIARLGRSTEPMSQDFFSLVVRTRNDMNADDVADPPGSDGPRFSRGFHRSNIATHEDRDVAIEEVFFANQNDAARFNHRVGGLDRPDKTAGFYQSQRLVHVSSLLIRRVTYQKACTKAIDRIKCASWFLPRRKLLKRRSLVPRRGDRHTQDPQLRFPGEILQIRVTYYLF